MIKNEELKTSPKQRIVIVLVAILMLGSTFALYAGIVLNYGKKTETSQVDSEKQARFEELYAEYDEKVQAQAKELSNKYLAEFSKYTGRVKAFNAAGATELKVEDLKVGAGRELTSTSDVDYAAYYIGWLSDENVFDMSLDSLTDPTKLNSPLVGSESMIQGWLEGISRNEENGTVYWEGMRIGGVREITIPAALGYGAVDQGSIPANSPLKFVVMIIDAPEEIEIPAELEELYTELYG